jgi:hypothetical protein
VAGLKQEIVILRRPRIKVSLGELPPVVAATAAVLVKKRIMSQRIIIADAGCLQQAFFSATSFGQQIMEFRSTVENKKGLDAAPSFSSWVCM